MTVPDFRGAYHLAAPSSTGNVLSAGNASDYTTIAAIENSNRALVQSLVKRRGNGALLSTVRTADTDHNAATDRTEITNANVQYGVPVGSPLDRIYLAISVLLPSRGFCDNVASEFKVIHQNFGQVGASGAGSPPFALEIALSGGQQVFQLKRRGGTKANAGAAAPYSGQHDIAPVTLDVWHDFLFDITYSKTDDGSGIINAYHWQGNTPAPGAALGSPVFTDTGPNILTISAVDYGGIIEGQGAYRTTRQPSDKLYHGGLWVCSRSARHAMQLFQDPTSLATEYGADLPLVNGGWWRLGDAAANAPDSSALTHTGTLSSAPTPTGPALLTSDGTKASMSFAPANSYVQLPSAACVGNSLTCTISLLVRAVTPGASMSASPTIYSEGIAGSNSQYFQFSLTGSSGNPNFTLHGADATSRSVVQPGSVATNPPQIAVNDGATHAISVRVTQATASVAGLMELFIDGRFIASTVLPANSATAGLNQAAIGALWRSSAALFAASLVYIQDVKTNPTALTDDRIAAYYDATVRQPTASVPAGPTVPTYTKTRKLAMA